ncbi:NUDIX domain-containing protein [Mucilaginibacter robiniae]|uniref:GDP-mannose pyrophosphatase n=1 Tax=Mucilaginibacter robiniae TaxID=2728022 RepID=A0A7L5DWT6_9SPHI|nr:NUDIX domain-containing protein [Mucilaginibacter robiniae]QJD95560.1 NUDIX domain-containing protein [Mucilaginibacter robiniae]
MAEIQITNCETLSDRKFPLKYYTFQKPDTKGAMHPQENEVYFRPDAVAVLLYNAELKTFLFTRQFRLPTYLNGNDEGYLVETCAGLIDEGETPDQAAIREVNEELGYKIADLNKVGAVYTSGGGITEYIHLFIAPYNDTMKQGEGGGAKGEGEDITILEIGFDEAYEKLKQGAVNDAKTVIVLQHYFLYYK